MREQILLLTQQWSAQLLLGTQVLLILLVAYVLQRLVARAIGRLTERYPLPRELLLPVAGGLRWFIIGGALMMILERFGVSATVLWTAISGFVAVAAVAFFAIWSVLSNLFCAVLILTIGPFRIGDLVEVVDAPDKPGIRGRVAAINLLYTTLEEQGESAAGGLVHIPNSMFFQKAVRRWRGNEPPPPQPNITHEK